MQNQPGYGPASYGTPPSGGSSTGLQPNIAAPLSYVFIPITGIIFLVLEKSSKLVRFHAIQSLLYGAAFFVLAIVLTIVLMVLTGVLGFVSSTLAGIFGLISLLFWLVFSVAFLAGWVMSIIKAYQGVTFKLPVIGNIAENMTNK